MSTGILAPAGEPKRRMTARSSGGRGESMGEPMGESMGEPMGELGSGLSITEGRGEGVSRER